MIDHIGHCQQQTTIATTVSLFQSPDNRNRSPSSLGRAIWAQAIWMPPSSMGLPSAALQQHDYSINIIINVHSYSYIYIYMCVCVSPSITIQILSIDIRCFPSLSPLHHHFWFNPWQLRSPCGSTWRNGSFSYGLKQHLCRTCTHDG